MNLVAAALRRPYTVLAAIVAVVLGAFVGIQEMPRDIFPPLGVPTIYVAQPYGGIDPAQMEGFIAYYYEYHFLYITGIEHVESKSVQGNALLKLQFHAGTDMAQAMAETVSYVNRARAFMPPGTVPPFVTRFDAGSVPVGNLVFSSNTRTVAEIQDAALNKVRPLFATLPGVSAPPPFGGSARTILIKADPNKLRAYNMSPDEVVTAMTAANTIAPSGNIRIGNSMPIVPTNATVSNIKDLESVPIRTGTAQTVFVRDIGTVEDGSDIATGFALVNGRRTVFIPVTKRADASTLSVVSLVKQNLSKFQSVLPDGVDVSYQFDQSPYVSAAISNLAEEAALGALLTGLMVLLFLRDYRSALIVLVNLPLSVTGALVGLWLTHQTVNIMTMGGLALAIGILVDEATVTIENIHVHLVNGQTSRQASFAATVETALPRLLAMLCILAVFTPALFMTGAAKGLFLPLSLSVGFAMISSYLLSSTLVPILCVRFLKSSHEEHDRFGQLRERYAAILGRLLTTSKGLVWGYLIVAGIVVAILAPRLGREIFPPSEANQFQLRLRAPTGTRIERTEALTTNVLDDIKAEVGEKNLGLSLAFVGIQPPSYPVNTIYIWTSGPEEAVIQVQLGKQFDGSISRLRDRIRTRLAREHPELRLSFEPSDIVSRVMSFGAQTPVEIAISSPSLPASLEFADKVRASIQGLKFIRDIQVLPSQDYPTLKIDVDRQWAGIAGTTESDVVKSTTVATSSSRFTVPNYWADSKSGIAYNLQVQIPIDAMKSAEDLKNIPIRTKDDSPLSLRDVAKVTAGVTPGEYDRYNGQRVISVTANLEGIDLGSALQQISSAISKVGPPPAKTTLRIGGQAPAMEEVLSGFRTGLVLAAVVIFLLLAANFQSARLPVVILSSLPATAVGVMFSLWMTGTSINVQSGTGAIMAIGISVANAILLVSFAEKSRLEGMTASEAAIDAGQSRLRPILMTSFAMLAGMVPMALGLGEGGAQTAPLGRAVIGGLAASTLATLFILPSVFSLIQAKVGRQNVSLHPEAEVSHD